MKQITLIALTTLACCSLSGCGGQNSKQAKQASEASSLKVANAKLKKKISKKKHHQNQPASSSAVSSSTKQSNQQSTQSSNNQQLSSPQGVNNADQAVAAARAKYGDQNGYIHWGYMIDGDTGQPSRFDDGSYFVKGTANDGTMTGTQYSLRVYPDGSIVSN
ncbi:MAG: hypothetical protein LKJ41_05705 [[Lactobacillus] timonensis]|jgi:cobalamin biosynthesis Mg chelatase CobN|uniref:hypothetical protein n=1 Tax=[Lactobacillus] timonensis TaxID=1970790 RepID=UPI0023526B49|nr:hypothetical protein [[Lactobacillus] timonensis]MCI1926456.1 hypothetical protein [[Lactobacillus] timonensis]MCI1957857.1 hypothetical protein [[Lactobacillus] timonensis]